MKLDELKQFAKSVTQGKEQTLKPQDKFKFKCTGCGKCCFNNDVMLNIYDLVRLRNALKLPTQEIIKNKFLQFYLGASSGLPVLSINFQDIGSKMTRCPLLAPAIHINAIINVVKTKTKDKTKQKELLEKYSKNPQAIYEDLSKDLKGVKVDRWLCSVHKQRPMICRLFPLGRVKILDKKGKELFILQKKQDWCPGWKTKNEYTLRSFLKECDFKHYKQGSDESYSLMNKLVTSGFYAKTKDNEKSKIKPLFDDKSSILMFLGNLLYNFDSITYFSKDKIVVKTIQDSKATHKEFMYVVHKVDKIVDYFIKLFKQKDIKKEDFDKFINTFLKGEVKNRV